MFVRKLSDDGDLVYEAGRPALVQDADADAQAIRVLLSTLRGEVPLHPLRGLPLSIFDTPDDADAKAAISDVIRRSGRAQPETVTRVNEDDKTRSHAYAVSARRRDGTLTTLDIALGG